MLCERIYFDHSSGESYLDTYVSGVCFEPRPAMLVIPGGGYRAVCSDREGEAIAEAYVARGYNAFVLQYRVGEGHLYPEQLTDAAAAMLHIRRNSEKYMIDPKRVYAVGFSAGGHLTGALGLMVSDKLVTDALGATEEEIRPDAIVLSYPVVSAYAPTHEGSFVNLLGKPFDELTDSERETHSLERRVTKNSPPAFIWHTATDGAVPPLGSLKLCRSYIENNIPVTLRVYPYGPHGIALADKVTNRTEAGVQPLAEGWVDESVAFLATLNRA